MFQTEMSQGIVMMHRISHPVLHKIISLNHCHEKLLSENKKEAPKGIIIATGPLVIKPRLAQKNKRNRNL